MPFKKLMKIFKSDDEELEESIVDPIVEQRRKEKFSTPLIYDEEEESKAVPEKKAVNKMPTVKKVKVEQPLNYSMTEIISPMMGKKEPVKVEQKPKVTTVKKRKTLDIKDQLVPVISPFYGSQVIEETEDVESGAEQVIVENKVPNSVTENLRNLAKIIQEEDSQLKIVESRTGEFQLDYSNLNDEEKTLIDEIDGDMSLDELMKLYEKKKMTSE